MNAHLNNQSLSLYSRISLSLPLILASVLSVFLLIFVGFNEVLKNAANFERERIDIQAEILKGAAESFLKAGLPLEQINGLDEIAQSLVTSDKSIKAITFYDQNQISLMPAVQGDSRDDIQMNHWIFVPMIKKANLNNSITAQYALNNRFEQVGSFEIEINQMVLANKVVAAFVDKLQMFYLLTAFFSVIVIYLIGKKPWYEDLVFSAFFLISAAVVSMLLIEVYSDGIQSKTQVLGDNLSQRLGPISQYGLEINDFEGIESLLIDYQKLNPDIQSISISVLGEGGLNERLVGYNDKLVSTTAAFEYQKKIGEVDQGALGVKVISLSVPKSVVYHAVLRNAQTFLALLIGCALIAGLFIKWAAVLQKIDFPPLSSKQTLSEKRAERANKDDFCNFKFFGRTGANITKDQMLQLIKPAYFISVFIEATNNSFLPKHLSGVAEAAGLAQSFSAIIFMLFFAAFALVLLPAGRYADKNGPKMILLLGAVLQTLAQVTLASSMELNSVVAARVLSGAGQGLFLIGIQAFILRYSSDSSRTKAASIIVFGFNAGLISGTAIGSLMSVYIGISGVFTLGFAIGVFLIFFVISFTPSETKQINISNQDNERSEFSTATEKSEDRSMWLNVASMLRSGEFIKTILFVGIPSKATLTGITFFAIPLVLTERGYENDTIGLCIMGYAVCVLISSFFIASLVDKLQKTKSTLSYGMIVSGLGVVLIGCTSVDFVNSWVPIPDLLVVLGVMLLGLAHGCILAPVITHIATSAAADRVGQASATAIYRFLERVGHILGPGIVAVVMGYIGVGLEVFLYLGGGIFILGFCFFIITKENETI